MQNSRSHGKDLLALLAMASLFCVGTPAKAQFSPTTDQGARTPSQDVRTQDNDTTRREVAQFDQFLDVHPEIAEQVRKDPSLLDKRDFVDTHAALQTYLQDHPGIRDEIRENPNAFMRQEDNFDRRTDDRFVDRERLDRFLSTHPEIAEQVRKDPSLLNNKDFADHHPALGSFLQDQPGIRDAARSNPGALTSQDNSSDRGPDGRDVSRERLDRFLDTHPEIAEQLHKSPSLLNNRDFVDHHEQLQALLQNEPGIRDQARTNPNYLRQDDFNHHGATSDRDFDRGQLSSFRGFLDGHVAISQQLSKNPSMVKDHDYVQSHPELQTYLNANPGVKDRLMANPDNFVKSSQQFDNNSWDKTHAAENKTAPAENKAPLGDNKPPTPAGSTKPKQ